MPRECQLRAAVNDHPCNHTRPYSGDLVRITPCFYLAQFGASARLFGHSLSISGGVAGTRFTLKTRY